MKKRVVIFALALVLVFGCAVGGTLAWLTASTTPVVNTFTFGQITLTLAENTGNTYKMVPGTEMEKDPVITVGKDSEACWVYVKVEKTGGNVTVGEKTYSFDNFLTVTMAEGWTELTNAPGVYWKQQATIPTADVEFHVLANDKIATKNTVTKEMLGAITDATTPKLTFTAYAVQLGAGTTAETAWTETFGA